MTIHHHPTDETLIRYVADTLPPGPGLVVAAHLESCSGCRSRLADMDALGGALLEDLEPTQLTSDAFERTLERIDDAEREIRVVAPVTAPAMPGGFVLPRALDGCEVGPWRWVGPGVRVSRVRLPRHPRANIILLKVAAGRRMPKHGHSDSEFTQVLTGSFSDGGNCYRPGDMVEADAEAEHSPVVGSDSECISLAAIEGHIEFRGFFGRLLQPLVGL